MEPPGTTVSSEDFSLQCKPWLTLCPLSVSSPCKVSHSEGKGKACWVVVFAAWVTIIVPPFTLGSVLIHSIRTEIQTHYQFLLYRSFSGPRAAGWWSCISTLILRMNADPENQLAGRASMSHITGCRQGRLTHPDPSSYGCRHGCPERRQMEYRKRSWQIWGWEIGVLVSMDLRKPPTLQSIQLNAQWMHTHACACFPCLCVWDQTSLAMGRREGPRYMFHFVHLPPPLMLCRCKISSKCCYCWALLKSQMVKRMAVNFSLGCCWTL